MFQVFVELWRLRSRNSDVRRKAVRELGKLRSRWAVRSLGALRHDSDVVVRMSVAAALGQIGGPRAIQPLTELLRDRNDFVRWDAAKSLQQLGWTPPDTAAQIDLRIAVRDWDALLALGQAGLEPLTVLLKTGDDSALNGLMRFPASQSVPILVRTLASSTANQTSKARQADWLRKVATLYETRHDPHVLREVLSAAPVETKRQFLKSLQQVPGLSVRRECLVILLLARGIETESLHALAALDRAALANFPPLRDELHQEVVSFLTSQFPQSPGPVASVLALLHDPQACEMLARWLCQPAAEAVRGESWQGPKLHPEFWQVVSVWKTRPEVVAALRALGWNPRTAAEQAWQAAALGDWNALADLGPEGHEAVCDRLGAFQDRELLERLPELKPVLAPYVNRLKDRLRDSLADSHELPQAAALGPALRDPELCWLVALAHRSRPELEKLSEYGAAAVPWLAQSSRHHDPLLRQASLRGLRLTNEPEALERIAEAARDSDAQSDAVTELLIWGMPDAIGHVLAAIQRSESSARNSLVDRLEHDVSQRPERADLSVALCLLDHAADTRRSPESRAALLRTAGKIRTASDAESAAMTKRFVAFLQDHEYVAAAAAGALQGRVRVEHLAALVDALETLRGYQTQEHVARIHEVFARDVGDPGPKIAEPMLRRIASLPDRYDYSYTYSYLGSTTGRESDEQMMIETEERWTDCTSLKQLASDRLRSQH